MDKVVPSAAEAVADMPDGSATLPHAIHSGHRNWLPKPLSEHWPTAMLATKAT